MGAELIPVAPELMVTFGPISIVELEMVTIPTPIVSFSPSIVTEAVPTVRIPTILASP